MPAPSLEEPAMRHRKVAGGFGTSQRGSSSAPSRKSSAGDGKPAHRACPITNTRTASGLWISSSSIRLRCTLRSAMLERRQNKSEMQGRFNAFVAVAEKRRGRVWIGSRKGNGGSALRLPSARTDRHGDEDGVRGAAIRGAPEAAAAG